MSIVTLTDGLPAILGSIRALESEHGPDDWPAVQMRDLTAMRDEIAHLRVALEHAWGELDDLKAQPQPKTRHITTAAELRQQAKSDTSCVGAFARARPGAKK